MNSCIFCSIVVGEAPSHTVWESETHQAFLSIFPNTKGFSVVIPKKHIPSYVIDASESDYVALHLATKRVAKLLDAAFDDVGRTGLIYEGYGVDHAHAKLIPMHGTAGNGHDGQPWNQLSSPISTYFNTYQGYLSSHDSDRANDDELKKLAQQIRGAQ